MQFCKGLILIVVFIIIKGSIIIAKKLWVGIEPTSNRFYASSITGLKPAPHEVGNE